MFQNPHLKRLFPIFLFFLLYSLLFFLWVKTFFYTLPFLLGLLAAILTQPLLSFLENKLHFSHSAAAIFSIVCVLSALLFLLFFLGSFTVREIAAFLTKASSGGFPELSPWVLTLIDEGKNFFERLDLSFLAENREQLLELIGAGKELILSLLGAVLSFAMSVPTVLTLCIVTSVSAFFFARDLEKLKSFFGSLLGKRACRYLKKVVSRSGKNGRKALFSYLFLYFITFCEAYIVLFLLGISYPLLLSFLTMLADLLPVFGPAAVFVPLIFWQLLTGRYARAAALLIGLFLISSIRQVTEPKLIAASVKIHPLGMLSAVYFSLLSGSVWMLFYGMGLFLSYSALKDAGALPSFFPKKEKASSPRDAFEKR